MEYRYGANGFVVIFRNDAPMVHCGDVPSYRQVRIQLTDDQIARLQLRETHTQGETVFFESISRVIPD